MINSIDPNVVNAANGGAQGPSVNNAQEMRTNFMTLLVAQLKNQDPMNPMENAEMTSQLAQINTVSGIETLNDTMKEINGQIDNTRFMQASGLIGKAVLVEGNSMMVGEQGATTPYGIELDDFAEQVKVTISDNSGRVVRELSLENIPSGTQSMVWDGLMDDGTAAPAGSYSFTVEAMSGEAPVGVSRLNYAQVMAVSVGENRTPLLDLGGIMDPVRLESIRQII